MMKTLTTLLMVVMVGALAFTGFAGATDGIDFDNEPTVNDGSGFGSGYLSGPGHADELDRPLDGSNSPWMAGDERLDRFQERFDLTDDQMAEIQELVVGLIAEDGSRAEVRAAVTEKLTAFGVENPVPGPIDAPRQQFGPFANGPGDRDLGSTVGAGNDHGPTHGHGLGPMHGHGLGQNGLVDGSRLA